ncbi:MAG: cation diffusion facilitator family transporter [Candidatus Lokiarchaeota archaeon]|nr:cation diffusion facilitator family transporter [Candidatus Lokiarchaeota archaeon]
MERAENDLKIYEKPIFINFVLLSVNLTLFIIKLFLGLFTNSLALQADAFDNLTDIIIVIASLVGIIFVSKKPNEKFPYGYYRIENVVSLVISIFIFFTAYNIIRESISEILNFFSGRVKIIIVSPFILAIMGVSLSISIITTIYLKIIEKRAHSEIIESETTEKLLDNFISSTVLIGFIAAYFGVIILDSIFGLIIALFIIKGGYDIFLTSTKTLLDAVIEFDKRTELIDLIENFPKIKNIDNMEIRAYGRYIFLEVDLKLSQDMSLSKVDLLKKKLSNKIKKNFPEIFKIVITTRTQEEKTTKIAIPLEKNKGLDSDIHDKYGEAPFFGILEFENEKLTKFEILSNKFMEREKRKGILVSDWLSSQNIDRIYTKMKLKRGPKLVFENSFIEMVLTDAEILSEIVKKEENPKE